MRSQRPFTNRRLTEPAVWRRREDGVRNEYGEWMPGAVRDKAIRCITEPGGELRQPLPAGQRLTDIRTFYVDKSVSRGAADQDGDAAALTPMRESDVIIYGGQHWVVNEVDDFTWGQYLVLRTLRFDE